MQLLLYEGVLKSILQDVANSHGWKLLHLVTNEILPHIRFNVQHSIICIIYLWDGVLEFPQQACCNCN